MAQEPPASLCHPDTQNGQNNLSKYFPLFIHLMQPTVLLLFVPF